MTTESKDIGHIAPSYGQFNTYNTLVIRPEYRISLELGNIEDLFLNKADSQKGRMERMQVAGLFYFPLNHGKAGDAFAFGWDYYKKKILGDVSDADADKALSDRLRDFVVQGGALPPPAEDPKKPAKENFAKIRVPGGYTYIDDASEDFHPNHDADYSISMSTENYWKAEQMCFHDNSVLGAIPLKAKVETRASRGEDWKPAKGVNVFFQLAEPYELPKYKDDVSPLEQINCPPFRQTNMQTDPAGSDKTKGPDKHVKAALKKVAKTAGDPQGDNCPKDHGGKRGEKVAGKLFELKVDLRKHKDKAGGPPGPTDLKDRPGFHAEHADADRKKDVKGPFFPAPKEPDEPDKHKHAVQAKTNDEGYAGVIFTPSSIAGDRYRLRAYVGPPSVQSDGTGMDAVRVETGTFVIWRNLRISKTLRMPYDMAIIMRDQFKTGSEWRPANHEARKNPHRFFPFDAGLHKKGGKDVGYSKIDLTPKGDDKSKYDGYRKQMARAFCETDLDPGADSTEDVGNTEWKSAVNAAITYAKAHNTTSKGNQVDVDNLFITKGISASNSFALIPIKSILNYNKTVKDNTKKLPVKNTDKNEFKKSSIKKSFDSWFDGNILYPFIHALADKGFRPGLTLLQMPTISPWHACASLSDYSIGVGYRTCIMRGGADLFPYDKRQMHDPTDPEPDVSKKKKKLKREGTTIALDDYGYSSLIAHEWGHCLFRVHAMPDPGSNPRIHDAVADGWCVMTYLPCEGDLCGKCILSLRGWRKIKDLP